MHSAWVLVTLHALVQSQCLIILCCTSIHTMRVPEQKQVSLACCGRSGTGLVRLVFPSSSSLCILVDPRCWEAPAGCPGSMSRTENMSEEAVGENPAVVCLKAQCNFGSQAAAPFIDRALEEEPRACAESSTQFSFWVPAAFESQTHVQASPALPGKT